MRRDFNTLTIGLAMAITMPAATLELKATPENVVIGSYWSEAKPALRVQSGDTVVIHTVSQSIGMGTVEQIGPEFEAIRSGVKDRGPGGHFLTGPVYIDGAEPGDVLEVRIRKIDLDIDYAQNNFGPVSGFLPEDFPYRRGKLIKLDRKRMVASFAPNIEIPLRPFFGSMGVAPPPDAGRYNSSPPWIHAGNMDNKEFVGGTTLYIPVHVKGALFEVGDGHAGQGDGEVDVTAMETSLTGTFEFVVRKDMHLTWPRGETPTHYIVMGTDEELAVATKIAVREMIDFLVKEKGLSRDDAYMLASVAADFHITQLVDTRKGVHGMIAKSLFK
jgi:acetamidase/formamidase